MNKRSRSLALLPALLLLTDWRNPPPTHAAPATETAAVGWSCLRGNTRNSGLAHWRTAGAGVAWTFEMLPVSNNFVGTYASPSLTNTGVVYIGASHLYALDADTGHKRWQFSVGGPYMFNGSAAAGPGGFLFVGCDDSYLYALNEQNGNVRWKFKTGGRVISSPALDGSGTVYVGSKDAKMYAIDAQAGTRRWTFDARHAIDSSPVLGAGDLLYCQDWGTLYALHRQDGTLAWTYKAEEDLYSNSTPALDGAGNLYATFVYKNKGEPGKKGAGSVVALNAQTGKPLWTVPLPAYTVASPVVGTNGLLYAGCGDGKLYALNIKTGATEWTFQTGDGISATACVGVDGTVYVGSYDKKVYALDGKTGAKQWEFMTNGAIQGSPIVSLDGTVFVGTLGGNMYAIHPGIKSALPISALDDK